MNFPHTSRKLSIIPPLWYFTREAVFLQKLWLLLVPDSIVSFPWTFLRHLSRSGKDDIFSFFFPREVVCTGKSQSKFNEGLERVITNAYFERWKNFQLEIESLKCIDVFNKINNSTTLESSFFFGFNFNCFPLSYYCYYFIVDLEPRFLLHGHPTPSGDTILSAGWV